MQQSRCPECNSNEIVTIGYYGELMCRNCGLVLDDSPIELNQVGTDTVKSQASLPILSVAGTKSVEGKIVKSVWLMTTREKNFMSAKKKIELIASKLKLPDYVITEAQSMFKVSTDYELNVGRDNISLIYGCVYASCMLQGLPKTPRELMSYSDVSETQMLRAYKLIKEKLGLKIDLADPSLFVQRFGSKLELSQKCISKAMEIIRIIKDKQAFSGKNPQTLVASALYVASLICNEKRKQRDVANITGVIEVTIRKRSRVIMEILNF